MLTDQSDGPGVDDVDWVHRQLTRLGAVIAMAVADLHQLEQRAVTAEAELRSLRQSAELEQHMLQLQLENCRKQMNCAPATPSKADRAGQLVESPVSPQTPPGHALSNPFLIRTEVAAFAPACPNSESADRAAPLSRDTEALRDSLEYSESAEDDAVACAKAMLRSIANLQRACGKDQTLSVTTEAELLDDGWLPTAQMSCTGVPACRLDGEHSIAISDSNVRVDFMLVSSAAWQQATSELAMMREYAMRLQSDVDSYQQAFEQIRHGVTEASELQQQGASLPSDAPHRAVENRSSSCVRCCD